MIPLTNPYVLLGGVCGAALLCAVSFGLGHHQKTLEDAAAALAGAKKAVQTVAKQGGATSVVDQKAGAAIAQTQEHTTTLIQKVPIYVTRKADDQCIVSTGAVRLLDAAAGDTVPVTPSGVQDAGSGVASADSDSGVKLSGLVSADLINAGTYHTLAERLKAWDDWYDAQQAIAAGH